MLFRSAGSSVKWLKDEVCLIKESNESEDFANKSKTQIYFVPAFVGLGAPYWDSDVRGAMFGITADVNKYDIVKATLDAIAYQVKDVVDVMIKESHIPLKRVFILTLSISFSRFDIDFSISFSIESSLSSKPISINTSISSKDSFN